MSRKFGWKRQLPDKRDFKFSRDVQELPEIVDLRGMCPPIKDQGDLGSCTANAIASALEFARGNQDEPADALSRLFIYFNERDMEGTTDSDAGANIRDGMKSVNQKGVCLEADWPYVPEKFDQAPTLQCYALAQSYRSIRYEAVPQTEHDVCAALAIGFPVVLGITCYDSFPMNTDTGAIPMPDVNAESAQGGHAIYLCGYWQQQRLFQWANSWGTDWGNGGFGTIPFEYILDPDLCSDLWIIEKVT